MYVKAVASLFEEIPTQTDSENQCEKKREKT